MEMAMATASLLQRGRGLQRYAQTHHIKQPELHMLLYATYAGVTYTM